MIKFLTRYHQSTALCASLAFAGVALAANSGGYTPTLLAADTPGVAANTDLNLVNPWGILLVDNLFAVADNHTGVSTFYDQNGKASPLTISIPRAAGSTDTASPTGMVLNKSTGFVIKKGTASAPSRFIYVTEDGTISGFNASVDDKNAIIAVDNSARGAVYKGATLATTGADTNLFVTNFHDNVVEMYDANFALIKTFSDPNVPADFAPFNVKTFGNFLAVTFAKQKADKHDDQPGPGNGFVDIFATDGSLVQKFASNGTLNSPWGLALAPASFGQFAGAALVGNFGNGRISAFDSHTGAFLGQLASASGTALQIDGLWGLAFGEYAGTPTANLWYTAGPNGESNGYLGVINPAAE